LNASQRRYAKMGIHLAKYRYCFDEEWLLRTIELYKAVLANPTKVLDKHFPKKELLPGRTPIWAYLSRMKQGMGFRPRT